MRRIRFNYFYKGISRFVFLFMLMISACLNNPPIDRKIIPYFDLKGFFQKKQAFLTLNHYRLIKTLKFQGKKVIHDISKPDWSRELYFFKEADLGKPTWQGKYRLIHTGRNLQYNLLDSDHLNIREVLFYNWSPETLGFDSVRIIKKQNSLLSKVHSILVYKPDSAYSIDYYQDIRFFKKTHFKITVVLKP